MNTEQAAQPTSPQQQSQYPQQQLGPPVQPGSIIIPAKMVGIISEKLTENGIMVQDVQYQGGVASIYISDQAKAQLIIKELFERKQKKKKLVKGGLGAVAILAALSSVFTMGTSLLAAVTGSKLFAGAGILAKAKGLASAIPFFDASSAETVSSGWGGTEFSGGGNFSDKGYTNGLGSSDTNIDGSGGGAGGFGD